MATITITGSTFVPTSSVYVSGSARATTYVNSNTLTFVASITDQAVAATLGIVVANPSPGGGSSPSATLSILGAAHTPDISSVSPSSISVGSAATSVTVFGTGFDATSVVQWNGVSLPTTLASFYNGATLYATVPASDFVTAGSANVTVSTPRASPAVSNAAVVTITPLPPVTLTSLYPGGGPINTAASVQLTGAGFSASSTVAVNGQTVPSTFGSSTQIYASFPAASVGVPGNFNVTVTTPGSGGGTSAPQVYTAYISLPNNDIAYNSFDGLLYASVAATGPGAGGNTVVAIDPLTGIIKRQIFVGSNPDRLAISTDGTQLFVGLDGAGAVAQVDLAQGKVVNQFSLGGGPGVYNPPFTAQSLAAVPGSRNSVAVSTGSTYYYGQGATIYDSGVARPRSSSNIPQGALAFGSSASTLYMSGGSIEQLTVDATGITAANSIYTPVSPVNQLDYDNGLLYLPSGAVVDPSTGNLLGTFYSSAGVPANGAVISDSTLHRAFVAQNSYSNGSQVLAYNETTFNLIGSIPVNALNTQSYSGSFSRILRWGQNGLALSSPTSYGVSSGQIFILQSPLVKDTSGSPADLSVALSAPSAGVTGTAVQLVATLHNSGPNAAAGSTAAISLDPSLIVGSVTPSQGSCGPGGATTCDLGSIASGASATVTITATATTSGTFAASASAATSSYDSNSANNQATASTTFTGSFYAPAPTVSAISPSLVQAGSADFLLTVNGTGFNPASAINLGISALPTSYVSPTQLTANITAAQVATYGWAAISVTNPAPGGGVSPLVPLTIYALVNVPANAIHFDPYTQFLYASVPGAASNITGNSLVAIDPFSGAAAAPVLVGSEPTAMAETADGNYLYVSLSGSNSLAQYDPLHQRLIQAITLPKPSGYVTNAPAISLDVMPGTDTTLAVGMQGTDGILDISGTTATFRPALGNNSFPTFGDATHLYTYDNYSTGFEFYRYTVDSNGATLLDATTLNGMGGFGETFKLARGLLYGAGGGIANPTTTPPSQIATLPLFDFYGYSSSGLPVAVEPDPSLGKEFLMLENVAGTWAYGLVRYDLTSYLPEAVLPMPLAASGVESNWTISRFGQDGLALLSDDTFGVTPAIQQLMLIRGPFVVPQELTVSSAAALISSTPATIAHNSGNITLTLTGANFHPGVAVTWNGGYRTTTMVDSTHVSVAIPASDLINAGTASLVATNPGAPASSALPITIN